VTPDANIQSILQVIFEVVCTISPTTVLGCLFKHEKEIKTKQK